MFTENRIDDIVIFTRDICDDAFLTAKGMTDAKAAARGSTPSERRANELDMKIVEAVRKDVIQCNVYDGIT